MSKGRTQKQEQVQNINQHLENEAYKLPWVARRIAAMGYNPYEGLDVAAMTPGQMAGLDARSAASAAFGMPGGGINWADILPEPTTNESGIAGYSTEEIMREQIGEKYDELMKQIEGIFDFTAQKPRKVRQQSASAGGKK